ncbi:MAG: Crp/Fnr family transcriptional regulator [Bullifex sp.]
MNLYGLYDMLSLDDVSVTLRARRGHRIDDCGASSSAVFIKEGCVEVRSESGVLLNVLSSGDVYGISNLFSGEKLKTKLSCTADSVLLFVPKEDVRKRLLASEEAMVIYCSALNSKLGFLLERIALLTLPAAERVKRAILEGKADTVPRSQLASYLAIGRSALFSELKKLEDEGLIRTEGRKITVIDSERLKEA